MGFGGQTDEYLIFSHLFLIFLVSSGEGSSGFFADCLDGLVLILAGGGIIFLSQLFAPVIDLLMYLQHFLYFLEEELILKEGL